MHKTPISLLKWVWVLFLTWHEKRGVTAVRLEKESGGILSERMAYGAQDTERDGGLGRGKPACGLVEMDETCLGGPKSEGKRGCGIEKTRVLAGVSLNKEQKPQLVKMVVSPDIPW
jgi:hypothetical protein